MSQLPNDIKEANQEIKDAVAERCQSVPEFGKVWKRIRYADNLAQFLALSTIPGEDAPEQIRMLAITIEDVGTERTESRRVAVTVVFNIEFIQSYYDGTDEANSTIDFENAIGELIDVFLPEESLGFTDQAQDTVLNTPVTGISGEGGGFPEVVSGCLCHRKVMQLSVTYRVCK